MKLINFETIQYHSKQWAFQATSMALMHAVQNGDVCDQYIWGSKEDGLTPKEWNRLCAFFIAPHSQLPNKGSVQFVGDLATAPAQKAIRFIQQTIEKKVLNALLIDTAQPFEERLRILKTALNGLPAAPRWQPKSSLLSTPYCVGNEQLTELIEHFVGHHLSVNHPLQPYKVATKLPAALTLHPPARSHAGPM